MEKTGIINKYELVVIVDAILSQEDKEIICKDVTDAINKVGGKVINSKVWLEKQKFTFDIKKKKEGTYYLINFEMDTSLTGRLRQLLKIKEQVLRFEIIKIEQ